jgi:hypothetical protein
MRQGLGARGRPSRWQEHLAYLGLLRQVGVRLGRLGEWEPAVDAGIDPAARERFQSETQRPQVAL